MKNTLHSISFKITISVLSIFGLFMFCLHLPSESPRRILPSQPSTHLPPPGIQAELEQVKSARNKALLEDTLSLSIPLVTQTRNDIVVFKNGSCVINQSQESGSIVHSSALLQRLKDTNIRFSVHPAEQGNYIVFFEGNAIYQWVTNTQVTAIKSLSSEALKLYLTTEEQQQLPKDWLPTLEGKIGIVARSWLHKDIEHPKLHRLLQAYLPSAQN